MKLRIKILDILIILFVVSFTLYTAYSVYIKPKSFSQILIQGQNDVWTFPLGSNQTVIVPGPLGNTIIHIKDNQTWVESSPCINQTCVSRGIINSQGQWAACLPNHVLLLINENNNEQKKHNGGSDLDVIAW